ncbi:unnamed protein product [Amoebophrya sp. A120]|nr:unnamed protein product [Amoebophrya sp. A120]|eukprot:GSA120T00002301001.1
MAMTSKADFDSVLHDRSKTKPTATAPLANKNMSNNKVASTINNKMLGGSPGLQHHRRAAQLSKRGVVVPSATLAGAASSLKNKDLVHVDGAEPFSFVHDALLHGYGRVELVGYVFCLCLLKLEQTLALDLMESDTRKLVFVFLTVAWVAQVYRRFVQWTDRVEVVAANKRQKTGVLAVGREQGATNPATTSSAGPGTTTVPEQGQDGASEAATTGCINSTTSNADQHPDAGVEQVSLLRKLSSASSSLSASVARAAVSGKNMLLGRGASKTSGDKDKLTKAKEWAKRMDQIKEKKKAAKKQQLLVLQEQTTHTEQEKAPEAADSTGKKTRVDGLEVEQQSSTIGPCSTAEKVQPLPAQEHELRERCARKGRKDDDLEDPRVVEYAKKQQESSGTTKVLLSTSTTVKSVDGAGASDNKTTTDLTPVSRSRSASRAGERARQELAFDEKNVSPAKGKTSKRGVSASNKAAKSSCQETPGTSPAVVVSGAAAAPAVATPAQDVESATEKKKRSAKKKNKSAQDKDLLKEFWDEEAVEDVVDQVIEGEGDFCEDGFVTSKNLDTVSKSGDGVVDSANVVDAKEEAERREKARQEREAAALETWRAEREKQKQLESKKSGMVAAGSSAEKKQTTKLPEEQHFLKLQKKLLQIRKIEERIEKGEQLEELQKDKLKQKPGLVEEVEQARKEWQAAEELKRQKNILRQMETILNELSPSAQKKKKRPSMVSNGGNEESAKNPGSRRNSNVHADSTSYQKSSTKDKQRRKSGVTRTFFDPSLEQAKKTTVPKLEDFPSLPNEQQQEKVVAVTEDLSTMLQPSELSFNDDQNTTASSWAAKLRPATEKDAGKAGLGGPHADEIDDGDETPPPPPPEDDEDEDNINVAQAGKGSASATSKAAFADDAGNGKGGRQRALQRGWKQHYTTFQDLQADRKRDVVLSSSAKKKHRETRRAVSHSPPSHEGQVWMTQHKYHDSWYRAPWYDGCKGGLPPSSKNGNGATVCSTPGKSGAGKGAAAYHGYNNPGGSKGGFYGTSNKGGGSYYGGGNKGGKLMNQYYGKSVGGCTSGYASGYGGYGYQSGSLSQPKQGTRQARKWNMYLGDSDLFDTSDCSVNGLMFTPMRPNCWDGARQLDLSGLDTGNIKPDEQEPPPDPPAAEDLDQSANQIPGPPAITDEMATALEGPLAMPTGEQVLDLKNSPAPAGASKQGRSGGSVPGSPGDQPFADEGVDCDNTCAGVALGCAVAPAIPIVTTTDSTTWDVSWN